MGEITKTSYVYHKDHGYGDMRSLYGKTARVRFFNNEYIQTVNVDELSEVSEDDEKGQQAINSFWESFEKEGW